jgi:cytochrome c551
MLPSESFRRRTGLGVSIVRRLWAIASLVALVCALGLVSGCVSSSEEEAQTPTSAETTMNSAVQTDADGNTVTLEKGGEPVTPAAPEDGGDTGGGDVEGDVAAGESTFASSCGGCHMNNGQDAGGIGPQLAGAGLDAAAVETVVTNGRGAMPGGLASGDDLTNVVAYVVSIQ